MKNPKKKRITRQKVKSGYWVLNTIGFFVSFKNTKIIKKLKKNPEFYKKGIPKKRPDIDWEKLIPKLKPFELPKKVKPLSKEDIEKYFLKKGGKA